MISGKRRISQRAAGEKMIFCEQLNEYMEELSCTGKELAQNSGLSETVISRYRKGERVPAADSVHLRKLAEGIALTAEKRERTDLGQREVFRALYETLKKDSTDKIFLNEKLDQIIEELDINISKMAAALHYDASYLSKIRTGKRNLSNPEEFAEKICDYIAEAFSDERGRKIVAAMIGSSAEKLEEKGIYRECLKKWMYSGSVERTDYVSGFLKKMDEFDLDDYIRVIHFDTLKVPKIPFQLPVSRHYYGLKEMREGELDFLKNTVLSKSMEPLYLCSDMPVEDMAEDEDFAKKYMFGLAMVLKKGLHIHMIHNVERPMKEMMLGLENWIPLYMTGQVLPYYIKGVQNQVYSHLHFSSGTVAMTGDGISGHHDMAHYYLTNNKEEAAFYRKNMEFLLKKASPLMDIYRENQREKMDQFLDDETQCQGKRRRILTAPPVFVIPEEKMKKILRRNQISGKEQTQLLEYQKKEKKRIEKILCHSVVSDELAAVPQKEYEKYPVSLSLAESFLGKDILLSYEEYCDCVKDAENYSARNKNYRFGITKRKGFRNIQITCYEGKWCMVSKNKAPAIHFVIRHPKLRYALEHVTLPVRDEEMEEKGEV